MSRVAIALLGVTFGVPAILIALSVLDWWLDRRRMNRLAREAADLAAKQFQWFRAQTKGKP